MKNKEKKIRNQKRGIIYVRSNYWGDSLITQQKLCELYCAKNHIKVLGIHCDNDECVAEYTILESPGFAATEEFCRNNKVDVLVVAGRDRLGASTGEYLRCKIDLHKLGVEIISIADIQQTDDSLETLRAILLEDEKQV